MKKIILVVYYDGQESFESDRVKFKVPDDVTTYDVVSAIKRHLKTVCEDEPNVSSCDSFCLMEEAFDLAAEELHGKWRYSNPSNAVLVVNSELNVSVE